MSRIGGRVEWDALWRIPCGPLCWTSLLVALLPFQGLTAKWGISFPFPTSLFLRRFGRHINEAYEYVVADLQK